MKGITSVLCFCVFTIFSTTTWAQDDVCDGFIGAAFGLCNAYCEAMDCDSDAPNANEKACGNVSDRFMGQTGQLPPCEISCPCFTSEDLQGTVFECGENFPGFSDMTGILFADGRIGCSGVLCADQTSAPSCALYNGSAGVSISSISEVDDYGCRTLIMANCDTPNAAAVSTLGASSSDGSTIPFIDQ